MKLASEDSALRLGWIGTGVMGLPMARHLQEGPHEKFFVFTRTAQKAQSLVAAGAELVESPAAMRRKGVHVVFTMAGYPADLEKICCGSEHGLLSETDDAKFPVPFLVDMSTSTPQLAVRLAQEFERRGAGALDAPVSGGDVGARERRLSIMVGGAKELFERMRSLFERLTTGTIGYMGSAGRGQHTKMANQIVIASGMIGVCEGLLYAQSANLDVAQVLQTIGGGAAASFSLQVSAPRILRGDMNPGFFVEHFAKDLKIALKEAKQMNLKLPGLELAQELYQAMVKKGHGEKGTQALILALDEINQNRFTKVYPVQSA